MAPGYPILLDLDGRLAVVVGGGAVAERKVDGLLEAGALVRVIAPARTAALTALGAAGRVELAERAWRPGDLTGAAVAVAATGDPAVNRQVAEEARLLGVLVNVVDDPGLGDFTVPAVLRRGDLLVAVATSGRAPGLAGALRRRLERDFGAEWGALASTLADERDRLPAAGDQAAWDELLHPEVLQAARRGDHDLVRERIRTCRSSSSA